MTERTNLDLTEEPAAGLEKTRILVFVAFAFGIAWATAVVIYLTGGIEGSPRIVEGVPIPLAVVLMATVYMWAPAMANVLTRLVTGEGTDDLYLRPNFTRNWAYWVAALVLPGILTVVGATVFYLLFPQYFDVSATTMVEAGQAPSTGTVKGFTGGIWGAILFFTFVSLFVAPLFNAIPAFGEEFGWRGYLLPKLVPLGGRRAVVIVGFLWGVWHWPAIAMGQNYGLDYAGAPWLGFVGMAWFSVAAGIVLGWLVLHSGSVWPAAIGHGAINATFSYGTAFSASELHPVLGPEPGGIVGAVGWAVFAAWLLYRSDALRTRTFVPAVDRSGGVPVETTD